MNTTNKDVKEALVGTQPSAAKAGEGEGPIAVPPVEKEKASLTSGDEKEDFDKKQNKLVGEIGWLLAQVDRANFEVQQLQDLNERAAQSEREKMQFIIYQLECRNLNLKTTVLDQNRQINILEAALRTERQLTAEYREKYDKPPKSVECEQADTKPTEDVKLNKEKPLQQLGDAGTDSEAVGDNGDVSSKNVRKPDSEGTKPQ